MGKRQEEKTRGGCRLQLRDGQNEMGMGGEGNPKRLQINPFSISEGERSPSYSHSNSARKARRATKLRKQQLKDREVGKKKYVSIKTKKRGKGRVVVCRTDLAMTPPPARFSDK